MSAARIPGAADRHPGRSGRRPALITDARAAGSIDLRHRQRNYFIAMGLRVACFVAAILLTGWLRWTLFAGAVVLPYIAVLIANQADRRRVGAAVTSPGAPASAPQLTIAPSDIIPGEVADLPGESTDLRDERPTDASGGPR